MNIQLYLDPKDKVYYFFNSNNVNCTNCNNELVGVVFIKVVWDKLGSGVQYFCNKCTSYYKKDVKATFVERFGAIITDNINRNYEFVLLSKPVLKPVSDVSVFDTEGIEFDKVVDKTVYSNRPSLPVKEYLIDDGKDKVLNDLALNKFLLDIKSSVPAIEYEKQKLLKDSSLNSD